MKPAIIYLLLLLALEQTLAQTRMEHTPYLRLRPAFSLALCDVDSSVAAKAQLSPAIKSKGKAFLLSLLLVIGSLGAFSYLFFTTSNMMNNVQFSVTMKNNFVDFYQGTTLIFIALVRNIQSLSASPFDLPLFTFNRLIVF